MAVGSSLRPLQNGNAVHIVNDAVRTSRSLALGISHRLLAA